jgi:hypothetical protein
MSLNFTTFTSELGVLTAISTADSGFLSTLLPGSIDYAEQRLYREADFLVTYVTDTTGQLTANQRTFDYPTSLGTFLVVDEMSIYTPVGTTVSSTNLVRVPLQVASKQFVDIMYPSNYGINNIGVPKFFAPVDNNTCMLGPVPDQPYGVEIIGTQRPASLSAANSSTFLTQTLPDLFMAAAMVYATGYMKNFGAQGDNPQQAVSWEAQYDKLFASANVEELRKKYQSQSWQAQNINSLAQRS